VLWAYKLYAGADFSGVAFTYTSHDGEGGYPGTLAVTADYRLTASNALHMAFSATTDKATVVNICNHACACLSTHLQPRGFALCRHNTSLCVLTHRPLLGPPFPSLPVPLQTGTSRAI
jgi:hypothetical protein